MLPPKRPAQSGCSELEPMTAHPTSLTDLPDDILALIYSQCSSSKIKQAFRTACTTLYRSPAINSCIVMCHIKPNTTPETMGQQLSAFPKHARLTTLAFSGVDVRQMFTHLLRPTLLHLRGTLRHVTALEISGCDDEDSNAELDAWCAAVLPLLFPLFRKGSECEELSIELTQCHVRDDFVEGLVSQTCTEELKIECCTSDWPRTISALACSKCLSALALIGSPEDPPPLSLSPLSSGPLKLSRLGLSYMHVLGGLEACLRSHPLHELELVRLSFPPNTNNRLSSPTLKHMVLEPSLSGPELVPTAFPALQKLVLHDMSLDRNVEEDEDEMSDEVDELHAVKRMAENLAAFPVVLDFSQASYGVSCCGWKPGSMADLLLCLLPLAPYFVHVLKFTIKSGMMSPGTMRAVATLFPHLVTLLTLEDVYYLDDFGLSDATTLLPHLQEFHVCVDYPPRDLMFSLVSVCHSRCRQPEHCFVVVLETDDEDCSRRLHDIKQQWDAMSLKAPDLYTAVLCISD